MKRKKMLVAIIASGILLTGCTNTDRQYTQKGAAIGTVGGAALGAAIARRNPLLGALIGGAAGALIGGGIGQYMDKQYQDLVAIQQQHSSLLGEIRYVNKGTPEQNIIVPVNSDELFVGNTTNLKPEAALVLNDVVNNLKSNPKSNFAIEGYTDNIGDRDTAMKITGDRAAAVKAYIVENGIEENRVATAGYGQARPFGDNETLAGRKQNRRVEIIISNAA